MMNLVYSSYDNALSAEYDRCETSPQARPSAKHHLSTRLCHKTEIQSYPQSQTSWLSQTYGEVGDRSALLCGTACHAQCFQRKQAAFFSTCREYNLLLLRVKDGNFEAPRSPIISRRTQQAQQHRPALHQVPRKNPSASFRLAAFVFALVCFWLPSLSFGQGVRYDNLVLKPLAVGGVTAVSGALITVCTSAGTGTPCTPKVANIFSDEALTTPITGTGGAGTTNSDANGNYGFYIAPGSYVITITGTGIVSSTSKVTLPCTPSAACTMTGSLTVSGAATLAGVTCQNLDTIRCVNSSTPGADLGAKVNTADASLGSTPGTIWIDSSAGLTWTTSTTFSGPRNIRFLSGGSYSIPLGNINSGGFPYNWDCGGRRHAVMNFTGTTGVAFMLDWSLFPGSTGSYLDQGYGIDNCQIVGPGGVNGGAGNAGTGIQIGNGNRSPVGIEFSNIFVAGFTIGRTWGGSISPFADEFFHCSFIDNTQDSVFNMNVGGGVENVEDIHSIFGNISTGMVANDVQFGPGNTIMEWNCTDCSFDGAQISVQNGSALYLQAPHHENPAGNTTNPYISMTANGQIVEQNPRFAQDSTSGSLPPSFISCSAGKLYLTSPTFISSFATVTNDINNSGTCSLTRVGLPTLVATGGEANTATTQTILFGDNGNTNFSNMSCTSGQTCIMQWQSVEHRISEIGSCPNAASGFDVLCADSTAHALKSSYNNGSFFTIPQVIANGTATMTTAAITAPACGTTVTVAAVGVVATDKIDWSFNAAPAGTNAGLVSWPTAGNVNFAYCPGVTETPAAATINWSVRRP